MVTYKLLQKLENNSDFLFLLNKGIIPLSVLDKKCYYERYLKELKYYKRTKAIERVADEYNISEMTVRRAVNFMET